MAAYAALVSLMNLIDQIQNHPRPPITLHQKQVESLSEKLTFLEDFLEAYNTCDGDQEVDRLRSRIAEAAYAAEDVIESHIVDQIHLKAAEDVIATHVVGQTDLAQSSTHDGETIGHIQARCKSTHRGKDNDENKKRMKKRLQDLKRYFVTKFHPRSTSHGGNTSHAESYQSLKKAADDVIESHVLDKTVAESITHEGEKISFVDLYEGLQNVIQDMDSIKKDVMEIKNNVGSPDQLQRIITTSESPSTEKNIMVDFDNDFLNEVLDKLTGDHSGRQIISISGMGGIGKTTFARNVFTHPLIKYRFDDVLAWITISQEYNIREILLEILLSLKNQGNKESLNKKSEGDLGLQLHKYLSGRRYLIIMDDVWSVEAWNELKSSFPDNNNGSRIVITTRISKLASELHGTIGLKMSFLKGDKSWDLFCKTVFGKQGCPDELEQIGKVIAKNCKGLPLSIVVIGGLLTKSKQTQENWKSIAENLNSVVNSDDNERYLRILRTSYNQLPIHLKPCFLHMGSFPEDGLIDISKLVKQWVAEGFLKPSKTKILEEIAEEYLRDLIERNLIVGIGNMLGTKPIYCKIHDLLRDLCQREARKDKFLHVTSQLQLNKIPQDIICTQRRIVILESASNEEYQPQVLHALKSASLARSLTCKREEGSPSLGFKLLRVLKVFIGSREKSHSMTEIFQLTNSWYLDVTSNWDIFCFSFTSVKLLSNWNLQTLIIKRDYGDSAIIAISTFWMMPQLRHVQIGKLSLPHPCSDQMDKQDDFVMENLQTLSNLYNFRFSEAVVKRIPNVKELKIHYDEDMKELEVASHYCLNNLDRLHKLEYLELNFHLDKLEYLELNFHPRFARNTRYFSPLQNMSFPNSLKELHLYSCSIDLDEINIKIGSLPFLERLGLHESIFTSSKWETVDGQFTSLKHLDIRICNLECWTVESTHFPRLESLVLYRLEMLREIDLDIGGLPTLKSIFLRFCSDYVVICGKRIAEEQEENGNEDFQLSLG